MISNPLTRVAFVGAGYMSREHLRAFRDVPNVDLAGVYSRTRARADLVAQEFGVRAVCDSISELHDRTRADLVVVSVPELEANRVSRACFEFPWVVLLEKPAGYACDDAEDIRAVAAAKDRRAFVALNRRFYAATRSALADLDQSSRPRFIQVLDQEDQRRALLAGQPKTVVDNWMYANSVHIVDYLRLFGRGAITEVEPVVPWQEQHPWIVVAKVGFASGDLGIYQGVWDGPAPWAVAIGTSEKRWELRPLEHASLQIVGERTATVLEQHRWDIDFKPGLRLQAEHAIAAARSEPTELPTLTDALDTMRLVARIFGHAA